MTRAVARVGEEYATALGRCITLAERKVPAIIGIDGEKAAGKTSFANWLGWQLHQPVIHLDLFAQWDGFKAPRWRLDALRDAVASRMKEDRRQPLAVVEGILLLDALAAIDHRPDLLIMVARPAEGRGFNDQVLFETVVQPYLKRTYAAGRKPDLVVHTPGDAEPGGSGWVECFD